MTYVETRTTLPDHRKAKAAARELGMRRPWVIGHLVCLWTWAIDNVPADGSLAGLTDADLEDAAQWQEDRAGELMPALARAGFVDVRGKGRFLHDWEEYSGRLMLRRLMDRERKRVQRTSADVQRTGAGDKTKAIGHPMPSESERTETAPAAVRRTVADVQRTTGNSPLENAESPRVRAGATVPHHTVPNQREKKGDLPSRASARARGSRTGAADAARSPSIKPIIGIEPDDPRYPVAQVLTQRYRWTHISDEQWDRQWEEVDNEFPASTAKGADPAEGWRWLAEFYSGLPRDAGDPLEALFARQQAVKGQRQQRADAEQTAWEQARAEERQAAAASPIARELIGRLGAKGSPRGKSLSRTEAMARLRPYRGLLERDLWDRQLAAHDLTDADFDDDRG